MYYDLIFPAPRPFHVKIQFLYHDNNSSATQAVAVTIQSLYRDTACLTLSLSHDTLSVLRHKHPSNHTSHQTAMSQYSGCIVTHSQQPTAHPKAMSRYNFPLYRATVLGSSPNQFLHFFFVFSHFFFLFFISATGNTKKKKKYLSIFFFSFSSTPNKFIKIYFHSFFFSFTPCKTLENNFIHLIFFLSFSNNPNKFIKIYFIYYLFPVLHTVKLPKNFPTHHLFSYVLITKHTIT